MLDIIIRRGSEVFVKMGHTKSLLLWLVALLLLDCSGAEEIGTTPTEETWILGETKSLPCGSSGEKANMDWYKDDKLMSNTSDGHVEIISTDKNITIKNITESDEGTYVCKDKVEKGDPKITYNITVSYQPEISSFKVDPQLPKYGQKVTITCQAKGSPTLQYIWKKDGVDLKETSAIFTIDKMETKHKGIYECTAKNILGQSNDTITIGCDNCDKIVIIKQDLIKYPQKGEKVILECKIDGGVDPLKFEWEKNNTKCKSNTHIEIINKEKEHISTLEIKKMREEDAGDYTCKVSAEKENIDPITYRVYMGAIPVIKNISWKTDSGKLGINKAVTINCLVEGWPQPKISWKKDNKTIDTSADVKVVNDEVVIKRLTDVTSGTYQCTASNELTSFTKEVTISASSYISVMNMSALFLVNFVILLISN